MADFKVRVVTSIADIEAADWDGCANPLDPVHPCEPSGAARGERANPFTSHAFLKSLEASGAVGQRSGWNPSHLTVTDPCGKLVACAAAYLKTNSQGEYVFDQSWADAYTRGGGAYYPKLQVSIPFTPATGRRLLVAAGPQSEMAERTLIAGLRALCRQVECSSTHVTFLPKAQWEALGQAGFLQRTDQQFHFVNESYATFEGFLEALASRKRKMIRRERREAVANGIVIERLTGADITEAHWDAFFGFYMDTGARKWGRPYLNRAFFSLVGAAMAERILLVMAKRAGRYIAGAINFIGDDSLYGRNWGAVEEHPFLHFEVCYYQAIDFAIERGLQRVEAGAQGEHKLARGYRPSMTYSAHDIVDARLRRAVADYLVRERLMVEETQEILADHIPFRRDVAREIDAT